MMGSPASVVTFPTAIKMVMQSKATNRIRALGGFAIVTLGLNPLWIGKQNWWRYVSLFLCLCLLGLSL